MLKEEKKVRQIPGERRRRWFSSADFDLIVWLNDDATFAGFELCYDKLLAEQSLVWHPESGFSHAAVDAGENGPDRHKASPIHVAGGRFDAPRVVAAFAAESADLPREVAEYVLGVLKTHPGWAPPR